MACQKVCKQGRDDIIVKVNLQTFILTSFLNWVQFWLVSPPTKLRMLFPAHLQARELCPQTYSISLPLEWSQDTHNPTSINRAGPTRPKGQLSTVPLPDNCVMIPVFQDGSLPFQYTHKHSSPLRQALHI